MTIDAKDDDDGGDADDDDDGDDDYDHDDHCKCLTQFHGFLTNVK